MIICFLVTFIRRYVPYTEGIKYYLRTFVPSYLRSYERMKVPSFISSKQGNIMHIYHHNMILLLLKYTRGKMA